MVNARIEKYGFIINYRLGTSDENVLNDSFENDIFLKNVPEYKLNSSHTVMDIGAHIGTFSMLTARMLNKGRVFSYEPCSETYDFLKNNIMQNGLDNVQFSKIAIAGKTGITKLFFDTEHGNWGHTITKAISEHGEEVSTCSLNNIFENEKITKCNFIKFNCEGAEFDIILNSSENTLDRIQCMLILYHEDLNEKSNSEDLVAFLKKNKFRTKVRNRTSSPNRGWIIAYKANDFAELFISYKRFIKLYLPIKLLKMKAKIYKTLKPMLR